MVCKYFLPFCRLPLHSVDCFFCYAEAFLVWCMLLVYCHFCCLCFDVISMKSLPRPTSWSFSPTFSFFNKFIYLFIYFWLCWVFVSVQGLSLVAASGGHSSSRCVGLSLSRTLLLRSTGSRRAIVAHGPSCSAACGIFPDQGSNPCPLPRQADSQPLCHQGSPLLHFLLGVLQFQVLWLSL